MIRVNADPAELEKFSQLAHRWWDPQGEFQPLHEINPLRLDWIDAAARRSPASGCSTSAAAAASSPRRWRGAAPQVTGIDLSEKALRGRASCTCSRAGVESTTGRRARRRSPRARRQRSTSSPAWSCSSTCPSPRRMVAACATLVRPGGQVFFSTINRNPKSYLFAVLGAEYVLRPAAARHARLRRASSSPPSSRAACARRAACAPSELIGMTYNPLTQRYRLGRDCDVNYLPALAMR